MNSISNVISQSATGLYSLMMHRQLFFIWPYSREGNDFYRLKAEFFAEIVLLLIHSKNCVSSSLFSILLRQHVPRLR